MNILKAYTFLETSHGNTREVSEQLLYEFNIPEREQVYIRSKLLLLKFREV